MCDCLSEYNYLTYTYLLRLGMLYNYIYIIMDRDAIRELIFIL